MRNAAIIAALCLFVLCAFGQGLVPYVQTYGRVYCTSGDPQGPFSLSSCVAIGPSASVGGGGASCSPNGNWVMYNLYNASASCAGPATPMKAGSTSCQGGGALQWYTPYCDTGAANSEKGAKQKHIAVV
jgi:hypothetical protein